MKKTMLMLLISLGCLTGHAQQKAKSDTATKPQADYLLIGKLQDFQLLFAALTTPADVTPNQVKAIAEWINTGIRKISTDSTGVKK